MYPMAIDLKSVKVLKMKFVAPMPEQIATISMMLSRAREVGSPGNPLSARVDWTNQPFSLLTCTNEKYKTVLKTYTKH